MAFPRQVNLDRVGMVASTLCAVHCVLVALLFGLLPVLGLNFLNSPLADWGFVGFAGIVGLPALVGGYRKHHRWQPAALFVFGLGLVLGGLLYFGGNDSKLGPEHIVTMIGGLTLVSYHLLNQKYSHTCCGKLGCPHQH